MVSITYVNKKYNKKMLQKKILIKRISRNFLNGLSEFSQLEKYFFVVFIHFAWYHNFKRCSENLFYCVNKNFIDFTNQSFFPTSLIKQKIYKSRIFSDRILIQKVLFSINFMKFQSEKALTKSEFFEYIFVKKKPKF
jgi:hypothetical protein